MRKVALLSFLPFVSPRSPTFALSDKPYITKDDIDISSLLPSPPSETSPAGQLDLQIVKDLRAT